MRRMSVVLLVALAVAGCKKKEAAPPQQAAGPAVPAQVASASIQGRILERLDAPPYSYLRLKTAEGEAWAAVPKTEVAVGADVTVTGAMPMTGFESKSLKRTFETVYFGTLAGSEAAEPPAPGGMPGMPGPMAGSPGATAGSPGESTMSAANMAAQHAAAAAGPEDVGNVKVAKASGTDARTVAEVHAQRAALKEKSVTIRGKVVKFNENIMGRNWIHLRDGTGTAGKDNDITVTTGERVAVGDVVIVKGTVRVDRDFGHGYAYPVIVEEAKIAK